MNTRELDRLLCERLGIEGRRRGCLCDGQECRSPAFCSATIYPRLSTTGDGMLRLMEALISVHGEFEIRNTPTGSFSAAVHVERGEKTGVGHYEPTAPLALALAAAKALGIEVPE